MSMAAIVGRVLNERYEVLERIGEGGMAIAYRGRDRVLGRVVAIKIMRPELATDSAFLARFRREARAAAGITHEHIAGVYDSGSDGSYHYIVMEHVEGESLRDRLRREGPLPLREALRIATETAEALEAAHQAGVVHRDIKPSNILLGQEGQVKVTDFGIARAASGASQTDTSAVLGTVSYISPEQARGEAVGPQGDVYSLGATLFETLTGKPPFNGGDRIAILHKHVYDRAPRPSDLRPGLHIEVDSIVAHCLEKDLSRRFASARELISYLVPCPRAEDASLLAGAKGRFRRAIIGRASPSARRLHRVAIGLLIALVVLGAVVIGITQYASARGRAAMVRTPDVVGMSEATARELLGSVDLVCRTIGHRASDDFQRGTVLTQDPTSGIDVRSGTVVKVVLSQGPSHVIVPVVTQMSLAQAQLNLQADGLEAGEVHERYDDEVPAGYVASTWPAAGARVIGGTAVDIVLSLGPEPKVPTGPTLPGPPPGDAGREEILNYVVPADASADGDVSVVVVVEDEEGRRTIYEGRHRPSAKIPPQTIHVKSATRARIYVDEKLRAERQYLP
jgi:serine/threonine-protein kinase